MGVPESGLRKFLKNCAKVFASATPARVRARGHNINIIQYRTKFIAVGQMVLQKVKVVLRHRCSPTQCCNTAADGRSEVIEHFTIQPDNVTSDHELCVTFVM